MLARYDEAWIRNGNRKKSLATAGISVNEGCCVVWDKAWVGLDLGQKSLFHETTKLIKINHRCIQIGRQVVETYRHRGMDSGAIYNWSAGDLIFFCKKYSTGYR